MHTKPQTQTTNAKTDTAQPKGKEVVPSPRHKPTKDDILRADRPWLDNALTLGFLLCMANIVYVLWNKGAHQELLELAISTVSVSLLIWTCKSVFGALFLVVGTARANKYPVNQRKFADQSWQLAIHTFMTCYGLFVLQPMDWLVDTKLCFQGPGGAYGTKGDIWLERLYIMQTAVWAYTAFSHRWIESRHKDYFVMFAHHVVTIFLISMSWFINLKFGALVLLLHDASDIGVDLLKMSNHAGRGSESGGLPITEAIFISALLVWIYLRLWVYPTKLLTSAFFESVVVCEDVGVNCSVMRLALVLLQIMHVWWTYLLLRILVRGITHDAGRDVYEGSSDLSD